MRIHALGDDVNGDEMWEFLGSSVHRTCRRGSGTKARADKSGKACSQLYDGHAIDQAGNFLLPNSQS